MEYKTEIINISKIKEGFFIGDRIAGTSLDVVLQFKISHMINAAGSQILNQFETIGVRYLTLNWTENASQKLLDSKDEIQNRIVSFIDDAIENGEGLLAYSVKGQNRACIILIIYFMRKYFWSLNKCLEFLRVKKKNASIPPYFLKQLAEYEGRIKKKLSNDWYNLNNIKDNEEYLIRNTYLNSLIKENNKRGNNIKNNSIANYDYNFKYNSKPHVSWGDNNIYHKFNKLIINNEQKDLILQKNVKNVVSHMRLRPKKKCIKTNNDRNDNKSFNIYNYYSYNNNNNYKIFNENLSGNNNNEMKNLINLGLNMKIVDKINQISNNFNNLSLPKQKSNSAGKKFSKNQNNLNNNENYSKQNNDENNISNMAKFNNYFDNSEELKNIYNKINYKKQKRYNNFKQQEHIPKNKIEQYNSNNSSNSIFDYQRKRTSTYDKQNNNSMNNSTNIKQYINMPNNLNNNSINMINYSFINNAQNFNNSFSKKNNETYFEKKMSKTQQNFNKTKNHKVQNIPQNRMNNSASNFYNYYNGNKMNEYYNLMGKSFYNNRNNNNNNYMKYNREQNIYQMKRNINDDINFILNDTDIYANKINHHSRKNSFGHKKEKRNSTPNNLLPKNNQSYFSNLNNNQMYINYLNHSKIESDKKNELNKSNNYINNKSFILNPKNQCKKILYIFI